MIPVSTICTSQSGSPCSHCWHYVRAAGASQCCRCPAAFVRKLGIVSVPVPSPRLASEVEDQTTRCVVLLREDGWPYRQIAACLGKSIGACRALVYRARREKRATR